MVIGIAANKFRGIRAAACESSIVAICAQSINNANALCLGEFYTLKSKAIKIVDTFFNHMSYRFISSAWSGGHLEQIFYEDISQTLDLNLFDFLYLIAKSNEHH